MPLDKGAGAAGRLGRDFGEPRPDLRFADAGTGLPCLVEPPVGLDPGSLPAAVGQGGQFGHLFELFLGEGKHPFQPGVEVGLVGKGERDMEQGTGGRHHEPLRPQPFPRFLQQVQGALIVVSPYVSAVYHPQRQAGGGGKQLQGRFQLPFAVDQVEVVARGGKAEEQFEVLPRGPK